MQMVDLPGAAKFLPFIPFNYFRYRMFRFNSTCLLIHNIVVLETKTLNRIPIIIPLSKIVFVVIRFVVLLLINLIYRNTLRSFCTEHSEPFIKSI